VIASALYELSDYSAQKKNYREKAAVMMQSMANIYTARVGENKGFILTSSTGSKPSDTEVNEPLSYADYYYLEALLRAEKLK
jgi:hypothetical protein